MREDHALHSHRAVRCVQEALEIIEQQLQQESSGMKAAWVGVCSRWSMSYKSDAMTDLMESSWGFCEPLKRLREMQARGARIRRHAVPDRPDR